MNIALVSALCVVALAFGFALGRRTSASRPGRPGGRVRGKDRDIVL